MKESFFKQYFKLLSFQVLGSSITVIVLIAFFMFYGHFKSIEKELEPEIDQRSLAVAQTLGNQIQRLLDLGIAFENMQGVKEYFDQIIQNFNYINYIAISDTKNKIVYSSSNYNQHLQDHLKTFNFNQNTQQADLHPINLKDILNSQFIVNFGGKNLGIIHIGYEKKFIKAKYNGIIYDALILILMICLISIEMFVFSIFAWVKQPIKLLQKYIAALIDGKYDKLFRYQNNDEIGVMLSKINWRVEQIIQQYNQIKEKLRYAKGLLPVNNTAFAFNQLWDNLNKRNTFATREILYYEKSNEINHVRAPFFLLIFSESLSIAFLPMLSYSFVESYPVSAREFLASLPVAIFMFVIAFVMPLSTTYIRKWGYRNSLLIGSLVCVASFLLSAVSSSIYTLTFSRALTGVGYGISFVTTQIYLTEKAKQSNQSRTFSLSTVTGASAAICGAAIGGILAGYIGYPLTFVLSAFLSILSYLIVTRFIDDEPMEQEKESAPIFYKSKLLFKNKELLTAMVLGVFPGKMVLWTFLIYLAPIYLEIMGANQSEIGRVLMIQSIVVIAIAPLSARLSDKLKMEKFFLWLGSIIIGSSVLLLYFMTPTIYSVVIAIILIGIGNSIASNAIMPVLLGASKHKGISLEKDTLVSIYRSLEKIGGFIGPVLCAVLITLFDAKTSLAIVSVIVLMLTFFYGFLNLFHRRSV